MLCFPRVAAITAVVLVGCGGSQPAPEPPPEPPKPADPAYAPPPCRTPDDCGEKGVAAAEKRPAEAGAAGPAAAPPGGSSLTMSSITTDGLTMKRVSCSVRGNSLFGVIGGVTVAAGFAPRKPALRACSPRPYEVEIDWSVQGLKVTDLTARTPDKKLAACVEKALLGASSMLQATCTAVVVVDGK